MRCGEEKTFFQRREDMNETRRNICFYLFLQSGVVPITKRARAFTRGHPTIHPFPYPTRIPARATQAAPQTTRYYFRAGYCTPST